jgi:hypothetical protein
MALAIGTDSPEPSLRLRRSGFLAGAAFFLLVTSFFLDWWVVSNSVGGSSTPLASVSLWGDGQGIVHPWARGLTLGLLFGACAILFVRVASRGWLHEPPKWRRDVGVAALFGALALASGMLWPAPIDNLQLPFWGGRDLVLDNGTGQQLTIVANPGLGWFVALAAVVLSAVAWWMAGKDRGQDPE